MIGPGSDSDVWRDRVLVAVTEVQDSYIAGRSPGEVFDELLRHVLQITDSEYGYIGEVLEGQDGEPFLKAYAMTDISWDEASREIYDQAMLGGGFEFRNLQSLFGAVLTTGEPVIANDAPNDPRAAGTMRGHLPLDRFLGLPLFSEGALVGSVGVSNREGGYDQDLVAALHPFLATCGNLVRAFREHRLREEAEREAAGSRAHLRTIVEAVGEGILTVDAKGVVVSANASASRLLGEAVVGRPLLTLVSEADAAKAALAMEQPSGVAQRLAFQAQAGTLVTDTSFSTAITQESAVCVVVVRDATAAANAEAALRAARDEAERLNRTKNDFLATMSHELRTPLNGVLGLADLLSSGVSGELNEKQSEFVGLIGQSGRHLLALINDVLDLAKVEADRVDLASEEMDVSEAIREAVDLVEATAEAAGRRVVLELASNIPVLHTDPRRFRQVALNLLSNACKFTPAPARVGLRATTVEESGSGRLVIEVWDEGIGIAQDDQARLFQAFEQVDRSLDRQHGGTGLGLALSRRLARAQGGDITVQSTSGRGSTFTFWVPLPGS